MGLMDLFKNKNREIKKANDFMKDQLIEQIENLKSECRDIPVKQKLESLRKELESQAQTENPEAFSIIKEIKEKIAEAQGYIVDKNTGFALNVVSEAIALAAERRKLCTNTGDLVGRDAKKAKEAEKLLNKHEKEKKAHAAPKTRIDALEEERKQAIKERDKHKAEKERLLGILQGLDYYDRDIEDEMFEAERAEQEAQNVLNDINAEIAIEKNAMAMKKDTERFEAAQRDRTYSQDQMEMLQQDYEAMNAAKEQDLQRNLRAQEVRNENLNRHSQAQDSLRNASRGQATQGATTAQGNPYARAGATTQANPYARAGATTQANPYARAGATTQANPYATTGANPYGGGNNDSPLGSKADIARMNSILEQSQEQYNEKLEEASAELASYDSALRPLLQKRQTASPSECLVLDGKIDQLNAKRNKVAHTVKRLRNAIAQLDEQLTLMGKVEFQQDLESMKDRIQQLTGGRYADVEGLSMYLKDSIAKENSELENLGVSNAVIDSEEINMNSYSGANSSVADMSNEKDEDKYAALERELGVATR